MSPRPGTRRPVLAAMARLGGWLWLSGTGGHALAAPVLTTAPMASPATRAQRGDRVEGPTWQLLDGPVWQPADLQDTALVLVYFSTTCGYCRRHNQRMDLLARRMRGQALRVLAVALDGDAAAVRAHWREQGHGFPVTLSDGGLRVRLTHRRVMPMTVVLDRGGRLRELIPGEMSQADVLGLAQWAQPAA